MSSTAGSRSSTFGGFFFCTFGAIRCCVEASVHDSVLSLRRRCHGRRNRRRQREQSSLLGGPGVHQDALRRRGELPLNKQQKERVKVSRLVEYLCYSRTDQGHSSRSEETAYFFGEVGGLGGFRRRQ
ncbi:uncharacterized protein PHALS_04729 [Plasmopara halstedii]|uniref:Uncharacterized protein n=1 Tax=Plasmopara halstedii TaxID=4781 RepID=A0A0P1AYM7_PLAHL|nr:uncharacterized protein PHALS_04729 [Plasmopara halstedii]CEG47578.1 hypothetical protein PHALS_04729 [Plasmopara halstedii]|eukprot:XP_024583947.1 hypothetical protein PHALS_04729 [Plasmopara halstedii]